MSEDATARPLEDPQARALARLLGKVVLRSESSSRPGLRWVETGTGQPVVLVAGAGETCLDWATMLPVLASSHRVIAYDRAGLGASRATGQVTLRSQLDDLTALLVEVGPAIVVAHSWGGLLAEMVTLRRPDLVRALVLVDPFREGMEDAVPWRMRTMSRAMLASLVPLKLIGVFKRVASGMARTLSEKCTDDPETRALLVEAYVSSYASTRQVAMIGRENRLGDTCAQEVSRIRSTFQPPEVPMRILTAGAGKPALLQQRYDALAAVTADEWPQGRLVSVPDSGHYIHHDRPDVVADTVRAVSGL